MNVIILRGGVEEDDDDESKYGGSVDVDEVEVGTALPGFELEGKGGGDSEDADWRVEESIALNEAAEGLREGEEKGDKRNPRIGRDSTGLDREGDRS